tara:strand:+ start:18 stop:656 length:639 start_codon:yes stop_codon:yes gene_type:complete
MASNEHKNLSDINRHNPLGFEPAINDTVLSKTIGSSPTLTDGNLVWQNKSLMGVTNYKMQGYTDLGTLTYAHGEDIKDQRSPFQMDVDYGTATVSLGSVTPSTLFRIGQSVVITEVSTVTSISGWLTSNTNNIATIAICKFSPTSASTNVTPTVIDEIAITGLGGNNEMVRISETTITNDSLAVGDVVFPMIKENVAGSTIYINLNIQTTTY